MKTILCALLFFCVNANCQDTTYKSIFPVDENGKIVYTKVFEVPGKSKSDLFVMIKDLAVDGYSSQKAAIESEDKEAGYIAYKGYMQIKDVYPGGILKGSPMVYSVWHTLKFYIKDDKVKVVLMDLQREYNYSGSTKVEIERELSAERPKIANPKKREQAETTRIESMKRTNGNLEGFVNAIGLKLQGSKKSPFDF